MHYENRLLKLRHLQAEAALGSERRAIKEKLAGEKSEGVLLMEETIKKQARKVEKLHLDLETRIMQKHTELWTTELIICRSEAFKSLFWWTMQPYCHLYNFIWCCLLFHKAAHNYNNVQGSELICVTMKDELYSLAFPFWLIYHIVIDVLNACYESLFSRMDSTWTHLELAQLREMFFSMKLLILWHVQFHKTCYLQRTGRKIIMVYLVWPSYDTVVKIWIGFNSLRI